MQYNRNKKEKDYSLKRGKGGGGKGKGGKNYDKKNNRKTIEFNKTFKHFQNLNSSIPDYILEKLLYMPNNKGYIWKGIFCYGEAPSDSVYKQLMFEKQKNYTIIHEWDYEKMEKKIWYKYPKLKKELYQTEAITIKQIQKIH